MSLNRSDLNQLRNRSDVIQRLRKFQAKFEIEKGFLSINTRHQLHQDFLDLAQYYHEKKYESRAIELAQNLAEHAFKTPEGK